VSTGTLSPAAHRILGRIAPIEVAVSADERTLLRMTEGTVGLIVRGDATLSGRVIEAAPSLRVIGRTGIGYDNVDVNAATSRGIPVVITPGSNSVAVAEATMATILALVKNVIALDGAIRSGDWGARNTMRIGDLAQATLGLVGFGRISREVARRARAFDMTVLAYDPFVAPESAAEAGAVLPDLDELLARSDLVSLHLALTPDTRGLIDRRRLSAMKPGAFLINFGRGGLFESLDGLYDALASGHLGGLGVDVYPTEPPDVSHPIFSHPRVVFSPHVGGLSARAVEETAIMMSETMVAILEGARPANVANPAAYDVAPRQTA